MPPSHRSILPTVPGVPAGAAVLIAVTCTFIGFFIDKQGGSELTGTFATLYVIGCLAAALVVRYRGLFTTMVLPPLLLFVAVPISYQLLLGNSGSLKLKDILLNLAIPLVNRFPTMALATVLVLIVGAVRVVLNRREQNKDSDSTPRTPRTRTPGPPEPRAPSAPARPLPRTPPDDASAPTRQCRTRAIHPRPPRQRAAGRPAAGWPLARRAWEHRIARARPANRAPTGSPRPIASAPRPPTARPPRTASLRSIATSPPPIAASPPWTANRRWTASLRSIAGRRRTAPIRRPTPRRSPAAVVRRTPRCRRTRARMCATANEIPAASNAEN